MRMIELFNREYGFDAEIKVSNEAIEKVSSLLSVIEEEAFAEIEHEVIEAIHELDENDMLDSDVKHEIIIAAENKRDMSTYDSVTFELDLKKGSVMTGEIRCKN